MATKKTVVIPITERGQSKRVRVRIPLNSKEVVTIHIQERKTGNKIKTNGLYYGEAASGLSSVSGLSRKEQKQLFGSFEASAGAGQKVYFAHPKRFGLAVSSINGLTGYFGSPSTISVTDVDGYVEDYYLYESIAENLGSVQVFFKPQVI